MKKFIMVLGVIICGSIAIIFVIALLFIGFFKIYYDYMDQPFFPGENSYRDAQMAEEIIEEENLMDKIKNDEREKIIKYLEEKYSIVEFEVTYTRIDKGDNKNEKIVTLNLVDKKNNIEFNAWYNTYTHEYRANYLHSALMKYNVDTYDIINKDILYDNIFYDRQDVFIAKNIDVIKTENNENINNKAQIEKFTLGIFKIKDILYENLGIKSVTIYYYKNSTKQQEMQGYDEGAESDETDKLAKLVAKITINTNKILNEDDIVKLIEYSE